MSLRISADELGARLGDWSRSDDALYIALARSLKALICQGRIAPGTRLPAERVLAAEVNVSRGTVMGAYELLRDCGFVSTVHGSGTMVRPEASPVTGPREAHLATVLPDRTLLNGGGADGKIDLRSASWSDGDHLLSALDGVGDKSLLFEAASAGGHNRLGMTSLRRQIANHLSTRGLETDPEQVLVTTGAQQAITLVVQLYVARNERVIVEDPTYPGAVEALLAQQARITRVPVWSGGTDLTALRRAVESEEPRLVYLIPSVHNPTGAVLPAPARVRLGELLEDWSSVVIDDMTLAETQFEGDIPSPLASYVEDPGRVVTVGSLSKAMWDGLRIGWVRASHTTIDRLARLKSIADLGTPPISQALAQHLLADPRGLLEERRAVLRQRRDLLARLLRTHLPEWNWREPVGGLCLWVDTGRPDVAAFCETAGELGVAVIPASVSSASSQFPNFLRLPYASPPPVLEQAVHRLSNAWLRHRATRSEGRGPHGAWQAVS